MKINVFWFRRDLRPEDNTGLNEALNSRFPVLPVFIFDEEITGELPSDDSRITFIYDTLQAINTRLSDRGSSLLILKGKPVAAWKKLITQFEINAVYANRDYEPYALDRDESVKKLLESKGIQFLTFKDQVIFEGSEVLKNDGKPYTVFTPYSRKWIQTFRETHFKVNNLQHSDNFFHNNSRFPSLSEIGFKPGPFRVRPFDLDVIEKYEKNRDIPALDLTSYLSPHLRFGTVSIRNIVRIAAEKNAVFLNELIWREFFMQILFHYPKVVTENFRSAYDRIAWRNDDTEFERWCRGETGYPVVDAGMRQLNTTGYMHNRVRMITAGFLCKHLLIDWRWGEAFFARQLLDYELSSNNGNWQWAAGTGCDAAPYFRVFNPDTQQKKFDPGLEYVRKWVSDLGSHGYPEKIVEHNFARKRAIDVYRTGILK